MGCEFDKMEFKMIILTGASGGIGNLLLDELSNLDSVIAIYNKNRPKLKNKKISFCKINLSQNNDIELFVKKKKKFLKNITLVHCATSKYDNLLINFKEKNFDDVLNINLKSNFLMTRALLPLMIKNNWGRIIHLSSVIGEIGAAGTIPYGMSKTGLIGLSRGLAKEYSKFNITSNIIELGYFQTGLFNLLSDKTKKDLINQIPSKKLGKISNISNCIEFIIKSEYVNGAKISIDGGI